MQFVGIMHVEGHVHLRIIIVRDTERGFKCGFFAIVSSKRCTFKRYILLFTTILLIWFMLINNGNIPVILVYMF